MKGLIVALIVLCVINLTVNIVIGIVSKDWNISAICGWQR